MKKRLLFLAGLVMITSLATLNAQKIVLSESFEWGIPSSWRQVNVKGNVQWQTESSADGKLEYPATAYNQKSRAYLRNTSGQSLGYVTRLLTPQFSLEGVYQPLLRFAWASPKWTADFDTLRVYYKNSEASSAPWVLLKEYTSYANDWQFEEIELPNVTSTYQIAFEGAEHVGRGIVLDQVVVRSKPQCVVPHDLYTSNMVDGNVTISWLASYDAYAFEALLIKGGEQNLDTVDFATSESIVELDTILSPRMSKTFSGLESNQKYTIYVRSLCDEPSDWGYISFDMKLIYPIPFYEGFDYAEESGVIRKPLSRGWVCDNNFGRFAPYMPVNLSSTAAAPYMHSTTGSALAFVGRGAVNAYKTSDGDSTALAPKEIAWAISPELTGKELQDCQVRFWMCLGPYGAMSNHAKSVIVGIVEDPEDLSAESFTAIDTITMTQSHRYEEYVVSFEKYEGRGKHVAFVSAFDDKWNVFFLDDIYVEERPQLAKPVGLTTEYKGNEITLKWDKVEGATSYNVVVCTELAETPDKALAYTKVVNTNVESNSYVLPEMETDKLYFYYVQAVKGEQKGLWSNAYDFYKYCSVSDVQFYDFESENSHSWVNIHSNSSINVPNCVSVYSTDADFPHTYSSSTYAFQGTYSFVNSNDRYKDAWVVFPPVSRIDTMQIDFYMRAYSTSYYAQVIVGVMTNPNDLSTFEPITTLTNMTNEYNHYVVPFVSYTGSGQFIAIKWGMIPEANVNNYPAIDNVTIKYAGDCLAPTGVELTSYNLADSIMTVSWNANGMSEFDVFATTSPLSVADLVNFEPNAETFFSAQGLKTNSVEINGVAWGVAYYVYVRSVCDRNDKDFITDWVNPGAISIPAPTPLAVPYEENFDDKYRSGGYPLPFGWYGIRSGNYPYLYTSSTASYMHSSPYSVYMYNYSGSTATSKCGLLIAPEVDIEDMNDLAVTFWARASSAASATYVDSLYVGVMSDPTDESTVTFIDTISVPTTTYAQYGFDLDGKYQPSMGKHIVFTTYHATKTNTLYIDDVVFETLIDIAPFAITATDFTNSSAVVTWSGKATQGWQVVVATSELDETDFANLAGNAKVVYNKETQTKGITIDGLATQMLYYVYVRAIATDKWCSAPGFFFTPCSKLIPSALYVQDFEEPLLGYNLTSSGNTKLAPSCWTARNESNPASTSSYIPGIYRYVPTASTTTYAHSGLSAFYFYTSTTSGPAILVTPEIGAKNMSNVTVSFWARPTSASYKMEVGVMTNPDDSATFTLLYDWESTVGTVYEYYEVPLAEYGYQPSMGNYIAFRTKVGASATITIDDITITENACTKPRAILSRITSSTVRIATGLENSDNVRIVLAKDTIFDEDKLNGNDAEAYITSLGDKVVRDSQLKSGMGEQIEGLQSSTSYAIALLHVCGEDGSSLWRTATFQTLCDKVQPNLVENFENMRDTTRINSADGAKFPMDCWITGNKKSIVNYIPYVVRNSLAPEGTKALVMYTISGTDGGYAIMPELDIDDITKYQVDFLGRANGGTGTSLSALGTYAGGIIVGVVSDASDISTFVAVDTLFAPDNSVYEFTVDFSSYKGDADGNYGKYVAFLSEFGKSNVFYIDSVKVSEIAACGKPSTIKVEAGETTADISWASKAETFKVYITQSIVKTSELNAEDALVYAENIKANNYKVTGLPAGEDFYAYVSSICDGVEKFCSVPVKFTTQCAEYIDLSKAYVQTFDDIKTGTGNRPNCWTAFYNNTENPTYPYVNTTHNGTTGNGFYFYTYSSYTDPLKAATVALPKIADLSKVMISFYGRSSSSTANTGKAAIVLGYSTDISSIEKLVETFTVIDTVKYQPFVTAEGWTFYEKQLTAFTNAKDAHLVFQASIYETGNIIGSVYIDDIRIERIPTCFVPRNLSVIGSTDSSVTLEITPYKEDDKNWDVMITDGTNEFVRTFDTTYIEFDGIAGSTAYQAFARTNCGDGDVSDWTTLNVPFSTKYSIEGDQEIFIGFEVDEPSQPNHPSASTQKLHSALEGGLLPTLALTTTSPYTYIPYNYTSVETEGYRSRTGSGALYFYSYYVSSATATSSYDNPYVLLPKVKDAAVKRQLRFDVRAGYVTNDTVIETNTYRPNLLIGYIDADAVLPTENVSEEVFNSLFTPIYKVKYTDLPISQPVNLQNNYMFDQVVVELPDLVGKRLMIIARSVGVMTYAYLDNLYIQKSLGFTTPQIKSKSFDGTSVTFNWDQAAGAKYNVYVTDDNFAFPLKNVKAENIVAQQLNVEGNSATITGLVPGKTYSAYLQIAGIDDIAAVSARTTFFMPNEGVIATDSVITFDTNLKRLFPRSSVAADSAYLIMDGLIGGNECSKTRAYQGRIIEKGTYYTSNSRTSSYVNYSYGLNQSNALYFYSAYTNSRPYAVFTNKIASDRLDTLQVQFYARLGYENVSTNKMGVAISETNRAVPFVVGAMTDPNDFSTFEPLAELFYPENVATSLDTRNDPNVDENGNSLHYFRKFEASLKNLGDRYLAFTIPSKMATAYMSIDNVSFGKVGCLKPISLSTTDITSNSAVLRWESQLSSDNVLQVSTEPTFAAEALILDTVISDVTVDSLVIEGLEPISTYYWRIRTLCDAANSEYSDWVIPEPFATSCVAISEIGEVFTFEEAQGQERVPGATSDSYMKPMCWTVGSSSTYSYCPRVYKSTATSASAHLQFTDDASYINEYALEIGLGSNYKSTTSNAYTRQWAITPELDFESYDSLQLTFYMLPARYNRNTNKIASTYCTATYARAIIIGTIDDVDDIDSFTPIDTIRYSRSILAAGDAANYDNDWMFQKVTVPLKGATGKHIVFYSDIDAFLAIYPDLQEQFDAGKSVYNRMHIDDVTIEKIKECPAVRELSVSDITSNSAVLSWTAEEDVTYSLSVFEDVSLTQVLVDTVLDTNTFELTNLQGFTEYYWYVQKFCTEGAVSEKSYTGNFHTLRQPYVQEQFLVSATPEDWTTSNHRAIDLFNHAEEFEKPTSTTTWSRITTNHGIAGGAHLRAPMYSSIVAEPTSSTTCYRYFGWTISPEIELDNEHDAWLTVKIALNNYTTSPELNQAADQNGWDDQFIIAVSLDGGKTFERENAEIWNNETSNDPTDSLYIYGKGDHVLNDLPMEVGTFEAPTYKMDLSKFKGQRIKIGFYHESTEINARNYIHLGQFRVNYYARVDADVTACQFEELSLSQTNGFELDEDKIGAGQQEFERVVLYQTYMTDNVEKLDSVYTLKAEILEAATSVENKEICEGDSYLFGNVAYNQTGEYKLKGICSETGCDSIAILNLVVNPRVYTEIYDTICAGQTYSHHGKEFTQSIVYTDTLSNQLGCDSIVTLYLYQKPMKRYEFEKQICSGTSFSFTEKYPELNLSGVYVDTVQTSEGCDSIVTLDLKVVDVITNRIEVKQCANEPYTHDGYTFEQSGEQQFTYTSAQGCDSIVTVVVEYLPIYSTPIEVAICQGEPYTLNGVEYTSEGQFTQELKSIDGCDSIVTINITYKEEVAIYVDTVITTADLPYFYGRIEYPKSTEAGEYFDTIYNYNGDCANTLYHHLTIIGATYIIENEANRLIIAPSVISAGETVRIISDFSKEQMRGMTVAVYDMVGRRVAYEKLAEPKQIVLNYFNTAGVYTVRLTNAQGEEFIGRVVVK